MKAEIPAPAHLCAVYLVIREVLSVFKTALWVANDELPNLLATFI